MFACHRGPFSSLILVFALAACGSSEDPATAASGAAASSSSSSGDPPDAAPPTLELVGHSDLGARGMNSALAIVGTHVFVGSRTDGGRHANAGVAIVDVSEPAKPTLVGEIGAPREALEGVSSRELRADPDRELLFVLNFSCSTQIHECTRNLSKFPDTGGVAETDNLKVYDVSNPTSPALVGTFDFGTFPGSEITKPHEMFLWRDPADAGRSLMYVTTPTGPPALRVLDVSDPAAIVEVATWDAHTDAMLEEPTPDSMAHSISVSDDGHVAYLSYLGAGFFMVDTADLANGVVAPQIRTLTPLANRIDYVPPEPVGTHSAIALPGRSVVLLTDEVYGPPVHPGCPWGWARLVDVADPKAPVLRSEIRMPENDPAFCSDPGAGSKVVFTAHNPTAVGDLALVTWHSAGLVALDLSDAAAPQVLAKFLPDPLPAVAVEDPMFSGNPVAMWSYPVIKDGLIYVTDVRNGLYVLRYVGPKQEMVADVAFAEGNSSLP